MVPLFFAVVFGTLEGGRFVVSRMMLAYAVSVGARAAAVALIWTAVARAASVALMPM